MSSSPAVAEQPSLLNEQQQQQEQPEISNTCADERQRQQLQQSSAVIPQSPPLPSSTIQQQQQRPQELQATVAMCIHCFDTLIHNLYLSYNPQMLHNLGVPIVNSSNYDSTTSAFLQDLPKDNSKCPLFVTWEKQQGGAAHHTKNLFWAGRRNNNNNNNATTQQQTIPFELRGCIGTLSPMPVANALTKYALVSALQDQRFHPIHPSELALLRVGVSLLVQYESCRDAYDWTVGTHGIIIHFSVPTNKNGNPLFANSSQSQQYSATYLPEVAQEQGWDQATTIASLIQKAGYNRTPTPQLIQSISCQRYQSSKVKMTYTEYCEYYQFRAAASNPKDATSKLQQQPMLQQQRRHPQQEVNTAGCWLL